MNVKFKDAIEALTTQHVGEPINFLKGKVSQCTIGNSILFEPSIASQFRPQGDESSLAMTIVGKAVCALLDPASTGWKSVKASGEKSTGNIVVEIVLNENGVDHKEFFVIGEDTSNGASVMTLKLSDSSHVHPDFLAIMGLILMNLSLKKEPYKYWQLACALKQPKAVYSLHEKYSVISICDSIAYGNGDLEFDIFSTPVLPEEIERAVTAGTLEPLDIPEIEGIAIKKGSGKKKTAKLSPEKILENAKKGLYKIDYVFDYDVIGYIPDTSVLDTYVPTDVYARLLQTMYQTMKAAAEDCAKGLPKLPLLNNFALFGEPSGGKTALLRALAASLHVPYFTVTGNQYTEDDTVEGKVKSVNGNIQCEPTPFLLAFKNGGIVALEEINLWNTNVSMGVLGQALEGPQVIMEDGYIPVKRHALCFAVATFNPATKGSNELNEALQTRFRVTEEVKRPSKSQLVQIICNGHKDAKEPAEYIYMVYDKLIKFLKSDDSGAYDVASVVTLRGCQAALELFLIPGGVYTMREAIISGLFNQAIMKNEDLRADLESQLAGIPDYN